MRTEMRYAFVSYVFDLDLLICVTCISPCPISRSFAERICRPTLSKANLTTLLRLSTIVLSGDGGK